MERLFSHTKILIGLAMLIGIIVIGVTGYMLIEGDNFLNALYMTVITISTVGFGEVHQLSAGGKIFTMILIISSFSTRRRNIGPAYASVICSPNSKVIPSIFVCEENGVWIGP